MRHIVLRRCATYSVSFATYSVCSAMGKFSKSCERKRFDYRNVSGLIDKLSWTITIILQSYLINDILLITFIYLNLFISLSSSLSFSLSLSLSLSSWPLGAVGE